MLFFTYGSLKRGGRFHNQANLSDCFLREVVTDEPFAMYDIGYPMLFRDATGHPVKGELYEITEDHLPMLDYIEGEGYLYQKESVFVGGVECLVYLGTERSKQATLSDPYKQRVNPNNAQLLEWRVG